MDLWIRSQNRELLIKPNVLDLDLDDTTIVCSSNTEGEYTLGEYKTYERAIEVLDEIEKIIGWCQKDLRDVTVGDLENLIGNFNNFVYEMPKE